MELGTAVVLAVIHGIRLGRGKLYRPTLGLGTRSRIFARLVGERLADQTPTQSVGEANDGEVVPTEGLDVGARI